MNHVSAEKREGQAEETLGIADIIGVLGNEFSNIYLVDCESQNIEIYRYENEKVGVKEVLHQNQPYKAAIQNYIETNVFSEDKKKMQSVMDFDNVCAQLRQVPQFTVHYRVKREGAISYYYMKCARIRAGRMRFEGSCLLLPMRMPMSEEMNWKRSCSRG